MKKLFQFSVTVGASSEVSADIDLDVKVNNQAPRVRSIICLNDMSSLIGKTKFSLTHNSLAVKVIDECDLHGISSAFEQKFDINFNDGRYNYKLANTDTNPLVAYFQVELEY